MLATIGCASGAGGTGAMPRRTQDRINVDEIKMGQYASAYDLVNSARPRWLQARGPDTLIGEQGEVQVLVDDVRLGGVSRLRDIPVMGIAYIQWYAPNAAAARWGLGFGHGAIFISTRP